MQHGLVLVAGFAGSGKTEVSKLLSRNLGWTLLDKDTLTRPLVDALGQAVSGDPDDRQSDAYLARIRPLEYECLMSTTWEVLDMGGRVVATAPFVKEFGDLDWLDDVDLDCQMREVAYRLVWVQCDATTLRKRLTDRGASRDRWKLANWSTWAASLVEPILPDGVHRIDNSGATQHTLSEQCEALATQLQSSG